VGTAVLFRVDQHAGAAEFGLTIGERRNQGLGSQATRLVLDWAFTVMGLHNILLVTFAWNLPAIRAYSKAGFREIGRRRGAVVTYGQRYDQVLMDAVADEFTDSVLAKQAPPNTESPGRPSAADDVH
jgi:diamine N-acetyltransferase